MQFLVGFFFNLYDEVARHAATAGIVAVALHTQHHAVGYAGRNVHAHHLLLAFQTHSAAFRAFLFDDFAFAFTGGASRLGLHCAKESLLYAGDYPGAVAMRTGGEFGAVLGAGALTIGASHHAWNFQLLLYAVSHLFEVDAHAHAKVGTAVHATAATAAAAKSAESAKSTESAAKYVAELREDVVDVRESAAKAATCAAVNTGVAKLVVACTLVLVAKHAVGFGCFFEFLFSFFLLGIAFVGLPVGVIFHSHLSVGFLQFVVGGVFVHDKHFVIISLFCHNSKMILSLFHEKVSIIVPPPLWRGAAPCR